MTKVRTTPIRRLLASLACFAGAASLVMAAALGGAGGVALAAPLAATAPSLGAAASFSVIGKAGVTNTGPSVLSGNVGADSSVIGFTGSPNGTAAGIILAPAVNQAEADAQSAYLALTAQAGGATPIPADLTGKSYTPGVYSIGSALLSGQLTLNGAGVYVFLVASDLTTSGSISLINGATPCNVFWQVTSSAGLIGGSFVGTIIATTSITFGNGVSLDGRALALNGTVTLINDLISGPSCGVAPGAGGPPLPSYVDVENDCAVNGLGAVRVGLSAGVIVSGLGADITSATDTGANKIVRFLPVGHYAWHATPPAGHYMQTADSGVVDIVVCPTASGAGATAVPVLIAATGGDPAGDRALASRQMLQVTLGLVGLGLVAVGFALRRKRSV